MFFFLIVLFNFVNAQFTRVGFNRLVYMSIISKILEYYMGRNEEIYKALVFKKFTLEICHIDNFTLEICPLGSSHNNNKK